MNEQLEKFVSIGWSLWRYRWLAMAVAWLVGAATAAVVFLLPNRYEATARIFVDTQTILRPLMTGIAVQPNIEQQIVMLGRTLISRANVEKVAAMAGVDLSDGKGGGKSEKRIEEMTNALRIQSLGRDNLYTLTYFDNTPERAKRVVDSMVDIFVQSSVGASRKDSDSAKAFIDDQIKAYRTELERAEARLKDFRIHNIDMQAIDGRDTASRTAELATQLDAARLQLREAEQARDAAKAALANEKGADYQLPDLLADANVTPATPEIDARIQAQRRQLDALLQRFTDQHPDVIAARRLIKDLEEQRKREIAAIQARPAPVSVSRQTQRGSLAYQELTRIAATADVQFATARARVTEYESRMGQLRARLKDAPRIEAELARLNRDYAIQKRAYEELVTRRESATMYGKLDDAAGLAEFRVIDPAQLPLKPVFPNRPLLLLAALAIALAAGLGAAVVFSHLRPVFQRASELKAQLGLPLLGAVAAVTSEIEARRERREVAKLSVATATLVALFVVAAGLSTVVRV